MKQHVAQVDEEGVETVEPPFEEKRQIGDGAVEGEELRLAGRVDAAEQRQDVPLEHRVGENH